MSKADLSKCPWCGAGVKKWRNDEHTRVDWTCGSGRRGPESYQDTYGACRVEELEQQLEASQADGDEVRRAITWLGNDMGKGYCERHPDVEPLRAWGCPDCLVDAKAEAAELRGEWQDIRRKAQACLRTCDRESDFAPFAALVESHARTALARPTRAGVLLAAKVALADACLASTDATTAYCDHAVDCEICGTPDADGICLDGEGLGDMRDRRTDEHAAADRVCREALAAQGGETNGT